MHLGWSDPVGIELLQRCLHHLGLFQCRAGALGHEFDALDDLATANLEDLDDSTGGTELDAEGIAVAELRGGHLLLPVLQCFDRADRVPQLGGALVLLVHRGLDHPALQRGDQLLVPPLQE